MGTRLDFRQSEVEGSSLRWGEKDKHINSCWREMRTANSWCINPSLQEREREADREGEREAERERERARERDMEGGREGERETERQRQRERDRQTDREREREIDFLKPQNLFFRRI